jgi:uncharacterized repeat protein (TIGR03803 family)
MDGRFRFSLFAVACFGFLASALPAPAQTETVLLSFGAPGGGAYPSDGLIFDDSGNLYGTTTEGGAFGFGSVVKFTRGADGVWQAVVLHSFKAGTQHDGAVPYGALIFDSQGNLYGTTYYGGSGRCYREEYPGCGTAFRLNPSTGDYQVIYNFEGQPDGAYPAVQLVSDDSGHFYGTTVSGGPGPCLSGGYLGCGTVFMLEEIGGNWTEEVLHGFNGGSDGAYPYGPVTLDSLTNLYGTTEEGGDSCPGHFTCGTVFKLSPTDGSWTKTLVHRFAGGSDGMWPAAGLIFAGGNLYGTTIDGGGNLTNCAYGCGTVFELSPDLGGGWSERILHSFFGGDDGFSPMAGLTADKIGNLYGTTAFGGGIWGYGTVFEVEETGTETVLHSFGGPADGSSPYGGLIWDALDNLYGTTQQGGNSSQCASVYGCGTVFELTP